MLDTFVLIKNQGLIQKLSDKLKNNLGDEIALNISIGQQFTDEIQVTVATYPGTATTNDFHEINRIIIFQPGEVVKQVSEICLILLFFSNRDIFSTYMLLLFPDQTG